MSDWGITTKVPAEVVLVEGHALAGDLHLYARPTYPPGPETPLEMLNRGDRFFALTLNGGVTFVPKSQVVVVTCRGQSRMTDPDRLTAARRIELAVVTEPGDEFRGQVVAELPPSRGRTLDFLNGPDAFFELSADDVSWYFNKSRIRLARPLD
jgi:hypothetical protein